MSITSAPRLSLSFWHLLHTLMAEFNMSLNVCDVNIPHKRTSVLDIFPRNKVDSALVQESHLLANEITKLSNGLYPVAGYSSASTRTKGAAIVP